MGGGVHHREYTHTLPSMLVALDDRSVEKARFSRLDPVLSKTDSKCSFTYAFGTDASVVGAIGLAQGRNVRKGAFLLDFCPLPQCQPRCTLRVSWWLKSCVAAVPRYCASARES